MFTTLVIKNFKSIGEQEVRIGLKPLTVLVGANGSGKSSILEGLALLQQSLQSGAREYKWKTGTGDAFLVDFPSFNDLVHQHASGKWVTTEIHRELEEEETLRSLIEVINNEPSLEFTVSAKKAKTIGYQLSQREVVQHEHLWNEKSESLFIDGRLVVSIYPLYEYDAASGQQSTKRFLSGKGTAIKENTVVNNFVNSTIEILKRKSKTPFLSALRGGVEYEVSTGKIKDWVGKRGENLLSVLSQILTPKREPTMMKVGEWAEKFDMLNPWAGWTDENKASGAFTDPILKTPSNLALAGYGSRQVLSIITQLFWSEAGDLIMIEEPEISVHPLLQSNIAKLFAEVIGEGKQIIITTHSAFLPLQALGELGAENIAIYEVVKGKEGTQIESLEISDEGYIENWTPKFADDALVYLIQSYLRDSPD